MTIAALDPFKPLLADDSPALRLVVSAGTGHVAMTVSDQLLAGSGTTKIDYTASITALRTALASLIYTAGAAIGADTLSIAVTGQSGTTHTLQIAVQVIAATVTQPPTVPTGVRVSAIDTTSATLTWSAPADGSTPFAYQVEILPPNGAWTAIGAATAATTTTLIGLTAATAYQFRVVASNAAGWATSTPIATATLASTASGGTVSGSQSTGTTAPVIAGPASASVAPGAALALPGWSITDAVALAATGAVVLRVGVSAGSLTLTNGGTVVAGSGGAAIQFSAGLTVVQTVLNTLVYQAGISMAGDRLSVQVITQDGRSSTLFLDIAAQTAVATTLVAPSAPTQLRVSAATPQSVTLTWLASSVGSPTIQYQVQQQNPVGGAWFDVAAGATQGTTITVSGLAAGNSYVFRVRASNALTTSAISASVGVTTPTQGTTTTTAGVPGDPASATSTKAFRVADLMERLGVNTYSSDGTFNVWGSAGDYSTASVIAALNWLTADSGLTINCREYHYSGTPTDPTYTTRLQASWCATVAAATGAQFSMCLGAGDSTSQDTLIQLASGSAALAAPWLRWVEGSNEPNMFGVASADAVNAQQQIWSGCSGLSGVIVVQMSLAVGLPFPDGYITGFVQPAAITPYATWNNIHAYPPTQADIDDGANRSGALGDFVIGTNAVLSSKPCVISEWHPTLYNHYNHVLDPAYDCYYTPMFMLSAFVNWNVQGYYWWALFDYNNVSTGDSPLAGGMFVSSNATPKPVAYVVRAMYALTGDKGAAKRSFAPGNLDFTLIGMPPPVNAASPHTGGQSALFQASTGTYYLYLWNAQADPGGATVPVTVLFNAHVMASVTDYDIVSNAAGGGNRTALQSATNVSRFTIGLNATVHLLVIEYGAASTSTGGAPPTTGYTVSPNGTTLTAASPPVITDAAGNVFSLVPSADRGLQIAVNGVIDSVTQNVVLLEYLNGAIVQQNSAGNWYSEPGANGPWTQITDPTLPSAPPPVAPTTGIPTDPASGTARPARRIADLMERFGANVFSTGQDDSGADSVAQVSASIGYLIGGSGMTMLLRGYADPSTEAFAKAVSAATGCKFSVCIGVGDTPDAASVIALATNSQSEGNWLAYAEGGNEPNNTFGDSQPAWVNATTEVQAQQALYAGVEPLGIPVVAPALVGNAFDSRSYYGPGFATLVGACDRYNSHFYPNNGGPNGNNQMHDWTAGISAAFANKAGLVTEYHPTLYNTIQDQNTAAYWTAITLLSGFADFNIEALIFWELYNYAGFPTDVGLFANNATAPYPVANVIRAMYQLTTDRGATKRSFAPGLCDVSVTGLPAGSNPYNGGRWSVYQNSAGTFFIYIWNEQDALDLATTVPVTVTFNAGPMLRVVDYSLTNPASANPVAIQTRTNVSSLHMDLTTEVRLLVVTHS